MRRKTVLSCAAIALIGAASAFAPPETAFAQAPLQLRIIGINDFHGHLEPGDNAI